MSGETFVIHANLDCEATWAGWPLPAQVVRRISLYGCLLAALAPEDAAVEIWVPTEIDPRRLVPAPGMGPLAIRVGVPAQPDLAWAQPTARAANDRRLALALAADLGTALPGARTISSIGELAALQGPWICKAPWTAAGRDRCRLDGPPTPEQATRIARLLERFDALVLEPWMDRVLDVGVCATVATDGRVSAAPAHGMITDAHGRFLGIDLDPPSLRSDERTMLDDVITRVGQALAQLAYAGPFTIDAFAYVVAGQRRFHPLCEINARYSFGAVARGFGHRLGSRVLGFGRPAPGTTLLIAPADDGVTAWLDA